MLIYIADDDFTVYEILRPVLEKEGFEVEGFECGDALLEKFKKRAADLVILDVMMPPGPSGFVVCKELRKFSIVPILMLTSRDSDLDYQTAIDLGSDDFFVKPVNPKIVCARIRALFRRIRFERSAMI